MNPYIRKLFEAEFVFGGMMLKVQEILSRALGFKDEEEENSPEQKPPTENGIPQRKFGRRVVACCVLGQQAFLTPAKPLVVKVG